MTVTGTYRLQLHEGFGFADAQAQLPYLASLGVSHLYLSPVLQAVPGSHARVRRRGPHPGLPGPRRRGGAACPRRSRPRARPRPRRRRRAQPHGAGGARVGQRPAVGRCCAHGRDAAHRALVRRRLGRPATAGSGCRCSGARSTSRWPRATWRSDEHDGQPVIRYYDHVFPVRAGTERRRHRRRAAPAQHYQLAGWRESRRDAQLPPLLRRRPADRGAGRAARRLRRHPPGAARPQPRRRHRRLPHRPPGRAGRPRGLPRPAARRAPGPARAIWVEKILEGDERLPTSWACDGTTGYDAMQADPDRAGRPGHRPGPRPGLAETGGEPVAGAGRSTRPSARWSTDVARPGGRAAGPPGPRGPARADPDAAARRRSSSCSSPARSTAPTSRPRRAAVPRSRASGSRTRSSVRRPPGPTSRPSSSSLMHLAQAEGDDPAAADFAIRLQQTWGPVMAKGIEDTTFYRWHRLVALNEVGGDPDLLDDATPGHAARVGRRTSSSTGRSGMTTLSTHDTKRSEDVRARLLAVAGDAGAGSAAREDFREAAAARATSTGRPRTCSGRRWSASARSPPSGCTTTSSRRSARPSSAPRAGPTATRPTRRACWPWPTGALAPGDLHDAVADAAVDHNAEGDPRHGPGQQAAPADACPGSRTPTRAARSSTSRWSTPTTAAPVDYAARAARLARLRRGQPARRDLDDEKLLVTRGRCGCAAGSGGVRRGGVVRPAAGDLRARARLPAIRPGRARRERARPGPAAEVAALVTRAPHRLAAGGGWGDATVTLPEGRVARRAHRSGPAPAAPTRLRRRARRPAGRPAGVPCTTKEQSDARVRGLGAECRRAGRAAAGAGAAPR